MLTWKLRITVLWIFGAACNSAAMILFMFEPGVIRDLRLGEWVGMDARSAGLQVTLVLGNWVLPMVMAFLTLVLNDVANRWANGVVGAVTAVGAVGILVSALGGAVGAGVTVAALVGSVVALLIVWHAWKWPRPSETLPLQQRRETTRLGA